MAQTSRGRRLMGEITVVPYIDVMLVLLSIFMITAPLLTQGVKVDLPHAATEPLEAQVRVACVDAASLRPRRLPQFLREAVAAEAVHNG